MSKHKLEIKKGLDIPKPKIKFSKSKIAYATKAYHKLGEISRGVPYDNLDEDIDIFGSKESDDGKPLEEHLCIIEEYDDENYYGSWVTGLGFFDVRYPKETTRALTEEEMESIKNMSFRINSQPSWGLDGYETL